MAKPKINQPLIPIYFEDAWINPAEEETDEEQTEETMSSKN